MMDRTAAFLQARRIARREIAARGLPTQLERHVVRVLTPAIQKHGSEDALGTSTVAIIVDECAKKYVDAALSEDT